jgi:hypothetical protein
MCFSTPYYPDISIATENIICYKLVQFKSLKSCVSAYAEFKYKFNTKYTLADCSADKIHEVYSDHYSKGPVKRLTAIASTYDSKLWEINIGYHSYHSKTACGRKEVIVQCIIPKGAKYATTGNLIVSDQIIIQKYLMPTKQKIKLFIKSLKTK